MDVQPGKPANHGPENWFTGEAWIDPTSQTPSTRATDQLVGSCRVVEHPGA